MSIIYDVWYDESMDIIARGAQYKVIDTHDGRVRKVLLTPAESREVVAGWYAEGEADAEELAVDYRQPALKAVQVVADLLRVHPKLAASLGNPVFEAEGTYTQDKARVLRGVFAEMSEAESRRLIDDCIELILRHWQYGLGECVFNFSVNNGLDEQGRMVLLDFGEITTSRDDVKRRIQSERWLRSFSYKQLPQSLQAYYRERMRERLTVAELHRTWRQAPTSGKLAI